MTEMDDERPLFPSICKRRERINEKRKMANTNLEAQAFKMTRLAREMFPPGRVGDTAKVRVPDVDRGRCDSRHILGVITVDPNVQDRYKSWCAKHVVHKKSVQHLH